MTCLLLITLFEGIFIQFIQLNLLLLIEVLLQKLQNVYAASNLRHIYLTEKKIYLLIVHTSFTYMKFTTKIIKIDTNQNTQFIGTQLKLVNRI